jgi:hypothetical protein
MGVMQEEGKLRSHSFAMRTYGMREQATLNVVGQTAPIPDNCLAQGARKLFRGFVSDQIHHESLRCDDYG